MAELIARHSGQEVEQVMQDIDRDRFMAPEEAVAYGLVDEVLERRPAARRPLASPAMETLGIHHLGVAVDDLDEAIETYRRLFGAELEHRDVVPDQGVEAASLRGGREPGRAAGADGGRLAGREVPRRRGPGMHHVAYEVDDLGAALAELAAAGAELTDAEPRRGLFGLQVAFVHPDSVHGVLTEVVSRV